MKKNLSIVVATYNEGLNIFPLYENIKQNLDKKIYWEIIFVDDNSKDDTIKNINHLQIQYNNVFLINRKNQRGLSFALIQGALSVTSDLILFMDADLQHNPKYIIKLYENIYKTNYDIVSASRFLNNKTDLNLKNRYKISKTINVLINKIFKIKLTDSLSGFFVIKNNFFKKIHSKLSSSGFKILLDIIISSKGNLKMKEIEFKFNKRKKGYSKLDSKVTIDFIYLIIDKLIGKIIPARYILYSFVGSIGIIFHIITFYLTYSFLKLDFTISNLISIFVAMNFNYNANNLFTYSDLRLRGIHYITGMLFFYFVCSFGALYNFLIAKMFFEFLNIAYLSVLIGAIVGSIWNYSINNAFNWRGN